MPPRATRIANDPHYFSSLKEFLTGDLSFRGTAEIDYNGVPLHVFQAWVDAPTTVVSFSGAVSTKVTTVPAYAGYGLTSGLGVNRILISDPSLAINDRLTLGWYAGNTTQPDLQNDLTRIIRALVRDTRVVFFGPSGGGFACLVQAPRFPGSTTVVSNPQTDIRRYVPAAVDRYLTSMWGFGGATGEASEPPFQYSVLDTYRAPVDTSIVYLQNFGDKHVIDHLVPFLQAAHPDNRIIPVLPDLGQGHVGPDKESLKRVLSVVCETGTWRNMRSAVQRVEITRAGQTQPSSPIRA